MNHERRKHQRFELELPAAAAPEASAPGNEPSQLVTRDISCSGGFFSTPAGYPVGTALEIRLTIALKGRGRPAEGGFGRVDLKGKVVRTEASGFAVEFEDGYRMRPLAGNGEDR